MALNNPYSIENFLTHGWRGNFPLVIAFWGYYVLGRIIVFGVAALITLNLGFIGWFLGIIIWIPYWIWSIVMLWRSAFNSDYPWLGYVLRGLIYLEVVAAIFNLPQLTLTN